MISGKSPAARAVEGRFRPAEPSAAFGAPVHVFFAARNITSSPVYFSIGNDRNRGFRFLPLTPGPRDMQPYREDGGLEHGFALAPGEDQETKIILNCYLSFPGPGRYLVEAQFDFDVWDDPIRRHGSLSSRPSIISRESVTQTLTVELRDDDAELAGVLERLSRQALADDAWQTDVIHTLGSLRSEAALRILALVLANDGPSAEAALVAVADSGLAAGVAILDRFIASSASAELRAAARSARDDLVRSLGG